MLPKKSFKKLPPPPTKKPIKKVPTKKSTPVEPSPHNSNVLVRYTSGIPKKPGVYLCRIKRGKDLSDELRICSNGKMYYIHESASTGEVVGYIGPIERAKGQKIYDK